MMVKGRRSPLAAFSVINAGVHTMVRSVAIKLAQSRIHMGAVAPNDVGKPACNTFTTDEQVGLVLPPFNACHPLGRNGQPADAMTEADKDARK